MGKIVNFIIGILFFSMVILAFSTMVTEMADDYDVTIDDTWEENYNFTVELEKFAGSTLGNATSTREDESNTFNPFVLLVGAYRSVGISIGMAKTSISHFFGTIAPSPILAAVLLTAVTIWVTFAIIASLRKYDG